MRPECLDRALFEASIVSSIMNTQQRWAVVTGASSGIGEAFTRLLVDRGFSVLAVARRVDRLKRLADNENGAVEPFAADLTVAADVERVASRGEALGAELLVNCAGLGASGAFVERPFADAQRMTRLNIDAPVLLSHRLGAQMAKARRGAIINVASTTAFNPVPYFSVYAATKAFVLHFSEGLQQELAPAGVRVLAVCPGPVRTEFEAVAESTTFQRRLPNLEPDDVAQSALAALDGGAAVRVVGIINAVLAFSARLAPRRMLAWMMGVLSKPKGPRPAELVS
jgi:short-subunit dehydrogenase